MCTGGSGAGEGVYFFMVCLCVLESVCVCVCVFLEGRSKGVRQISDLGAQRKKKVQEKKNYKQSLYPPSVFSWPSSKHSHTQKYTHTIGPYVIVKSGVQCQHSRKGNKQLKHLNGKYHLYRHKASVHKILTFLKSDFCFPPGLKQYACVCSCCRLCPTAANTHTHNQHTHTHTHHMSSFSGERHGAMERHSSSG